jgi:surfactin synthase thioesterase subunit
MDNLSKRIAALSPAQRAIFQYRLQKIDAFENPARDGIGATCKPSASLDASAFVIEDFLLRLRAADSGRKPLFVIPGGWGGENEMLVFASMLPFLDRNIPVYAVFSRALDETWPLPRDLRSQAAEVLKAIRRVQPNGPYLILGECIASVLAVEVARQAEGSGEPPGSIILLDAGAPSRPPFLTACLRKLGFARAGWTRSPKAMPNGDPIPPRMAEYFELLFNWTPAPFRSSLHLIFTSSSANPQEALKNWNRLAKGEISDRHVSGDHHSYIRKHVAETATLLNDIFAQIKAARNDFPNTRA